MEEQFQSENLKHDLFEGPSERSKERKFCETINWYLCCDITIPQCVPKIVIINTSQIAHRFSYHLRDEWKNHLLRVAHSEIVCAMWLERKEKTDASAARNR